MSKLFKYKWYEFATGMKIYLMYIFIYNKK
jgi:hypothetical protein